MDIGNGRSGVPGRHQIDSELDRESPMNSKRLVMRGSAGRLLATTAIAAALAIVSNPASAVNWSARTGFSMFPAVLTSA